MATPTIAAIVPIFRAEEFLVATLESIRNQSYQDWVCLVVDDGSTDSSASLADTYAAADSRFRVIHQSNRGVSAARNTGLDNVPPEVSWLAFVDGDDTLTADAFERLLARAGLRPDAVGVYGLAEYMNQSGEPIRPGAHPAVQRARRRSQGWSIEDVAAHEDTTFESMIVTGAIWPPAVGLFRRDVVERAGRFDPAQRLVEDWDLFLRMSRYGPFVFVDEQVAWYRQHDLNLTRDTDEMNLYWNRVRAKAWSHPDNTDHQRRALHRVWLRLQAREALKTALGAGRAIQRGEWASARSTGMTAGTRLADLTRGHPVGPSRLAGSSAVLNSTGRTGQRDRPTVGVVVPAYQAQRYLEDTLRSIAEQTYRDWTCVIVDDGATDDTASIAARFAELDDRFVLYRQANKGLPAARNAGLDQLPPAVRFVAFVDSDDTLVPDAFEHLISGAVGRPDAAGVFGLAELMDGHGSPIQPGVHPARQRDRRRTSRWDLADAALDADVDFDSLVVSGTIWPPAVGLFRRDLVERAGRFDPVQRYNEDWDLWLRMSRFGTFIPIDRQVAWYRQHDTNMTRNTAAMTFFHIRVWTNAWTHPDNTAKQRRTIRHVWTRLNLRWLARSTAYAMHGIRDRDVHQVWSGARALSRFAAALARRHPVEPDDGTLEAMVRFASH